MRKILMVAAGAGAALATPAFANTADLEVTATVEDSCTVQNSTMNFGTLSVINGTNHDATASVSLTCTIGADYTVSLDNGVNAGAGTQRFLSYDDGGAVHNIPYNLYSDSTRSNAWASAGVNPAGTATGTAETVTVYGRIPSTANNVMAGSYTDTVTVSITF